MQVPPWSSWESTVSGHCSTVPVFPNTAFLSGSASNLHRTSSVSIFICYWSSPSAVNLLLLCLLHQRGCRLSTLGSFLSFILQEFLNFSLQQSKLQTIGAYINFIGTCYLCIKHKKLLGYIFSGSVSSILLSEWNHILCKSKASIHIFLNYCHSLSSFFYVHHPLFSFLGDSFSPCLWTYNFSPIIW